LQPSGSSLSRWAAWSPCLAMDVVSVVTREKAGQWTCCVTVSECCWLPGSVRSKVYCGLLLAAAVLDGEVTAFCLQRVPCWVAHLTR